MSKILEKSLKDARKENKLTMGSKEVLNSVNNSKLIVLSQSVDKIMLEKIESDAKKQKVPLVNFQGTLIDFDIHMNLTLDNAEDISEEKHLNLGKILLRVDNILAISLPTDKS